MTWCCSPNMSNQNLPAGSEAATAKAAIADKSPSYKNAVAETASKKSVLNTKKANTRQSKNELKAAQADLLKNEQKKENAENAIDASEKANEDRETVKSNNQDTIDENNERIAELNKDGSPNALAAVKIIEEKNNKLETENQNIDIEIAKENAEIDKQKELISESEEDQQEKENAVDTAEDKVDTAENEEDTANDAYEDAVDNEEEIKDNLVEDYPETYGELDNKLKTAKKTDEKVAKERVDTAKNEQKAASLAKKKAEAEALIKKEQAKLKALKDELNDPTTDLYRKQELTDQIWDSEHNLENIKAKIPSDSDKVLDQIINSSKTGEPNTGTFLKFDAKSKDSNGELEEIISKHIQPKNKHAYMGEFPEKLSNLDWMVKTIDRPKVDIESVEQMRFNVKRQYPVKYNIGDVSVTFWDDVDHKTVTTLYKYFTGKVWDHKSVGNTGTFMLRDSILIPKFKIFDLSVETNKHLEYKFENAVLTSFDFDASDDEGDETVYTVQAVFKVEKFDVIEGTSPRVLNAGNSPVWL